MTENIQEMTSEKRSHLLLSTLSKNMPVSLSFKDTQGRLVWVSKKKAENSGMTIEEMIGKTDFDLMVREEAERSWADDCRVMATKESITRKVEVVTRINGKADYVSVTKTPWLDDDDEVLGVICIPTDVSFIVQFLRIASHDIRDPLNSIGIAVKLLLKGISGKVEDASAIKSLKDIYKQVGKMEGIITDYISSSMLENYELPEKEHLDLRVDIIDVVLAEYADRIEAKGLGFDNSLGSIPSGEVITVNANRTCLMIIFRNLFSNAIRLTPPGGIIAFGFEKKENFLQLNVWDNGPAVEAGKEEEIFSGYSQDSTGLGLSASRDLIEKHGGKMWYETTQEGHPNFLFTLPC